MDDRCGGDEHTRLARFVMRLALLVLLPLLGGLAGACTGVSVVAASGGAARVKVHRVHRYWHRALAALRNQITHRQADSQVDPNANASIAAAVAENRTSVRLRRDVGEDELPHLIDSHPPLSQRLQALHLTTQIVQAAVFTVPPAVPAHSLVYDGKVLERRLTAAGNAILMETHQVVEGSKVW